MALKKQKNIVRSMSEQQTVVSDEQVTVSDDACPCDPEVNEDEMEMEEEEEDRTTGQVKWFNDVDGYGFIKPSDDSGDIFVHISDIVPLHNNFKPCLYTGEYVSFSIAHNGQNEDGTFRLKATNVKGVFGGSLMCDHGDIEFKSYSRVGFNA